MYLVREIMYCKPGQVRPLLEKFRIMNKLSEKVGMPKMRMMTDVAAEQYWTLVSEMEVETLGTWEQMMSDVNTPKEVMKEFEEAMKGYHDLVVRGKREIYKIET
jgi:hypothetical protein